MKKILATTLATVALFFISCGSTPKTETTSAAPAAPVTTAVESDGTLLIDDFEDGLYWSAVLDTWETWGNKYMVTEFSKGADINETWGTRGSSSLAFDFFAFNDGGAHVDCVDLLETDWTGYTKLYVDVNNLTSTEFTMQFYSQTSENWTWGDTAAQPVAPGESTLEFDITNAVKDKSNVLKIGFVLYECAEEGTILIDNIRIAE